MSVRAKMVCDTISEPSPGNKVVRLSAVTADGDESNKTWSQWTPSGSVELWITNPDAFNQFEPGKNYFVNFAPAE